MSLKALYAGCFEISAIRHFHHDEYPNYLRIAAV